MLPFQTLIIIEQKSGIPIYRQIANRLISLIQSGKILQTEIFPSRAEFYNSTGRRSRRLLWPYRRTFLSWRRRWGIKNNRQRWLSGYWSCTIRGNHEGVSTVCSGRIFKKIDVYPLRRRNPISAVIYMYLSQSVEGTKRRARQRTDYERGTDGNLPRH